MGRSSGSSYSSSRSNPGRYTSPSSSQRIPNSYNQPRRRSPLMPGFPMFGMPGYSRRSRNTYDPDYYEYGNGRRRSSGMSTIVTIILIAILFFFLFSMFGCSRTTSPDVYQTEEITESAYNREKLNSGIPYQQDCIIDELGWFENIPQTEKRLKTFYDKTGVQPMIVINEYNPALKTDQQKSEYAKEWYDRNIKNENVFLYMYFGEPGDSEVGYMETVNGKEISSVMDSNAVNIFWNYLDQDWTSGMNSDDMFVSVFDQTADRIMTKTATKNDVMLKGLGVAAIVAVGGVIIAVIVLRRKHERERAEETERILNTPLNPDSTKPNETDDEDLLNRYGGK